MNGTETVVLGSQQYTKTKGDGKADLCQCHQARPQEQEPYDKVERYHQVEVTLGRWDARTLGRWFIWKNEKRYGI